MGYHCIVKGRVQGVGFRYHTLTLAKRLNLTGWVRNDSAGTVTFEVYGSASSLEHFFELLEKGNGFIRIDTLEKQTLNSPSPYKSFVIVY